MCALNNLLGNIRCGSEHFRIVLALHMGTMVSVGQAFDIIIENKKESPPKPFIFGKSHMLTHRNARFISNWNLSQKHVQLAINRVRSICII